MINYSPKQARHSPVDTAKPVNALISTIFAQTTLEAVTAQYQAVTDSLTASFPQAAQMLTGTEADLTAFAALPREHWQKVWSNNPIKRLNRETKRRADVVQVFPDHDSVTRLIGAVLPEQHEEWQYGERRYFSDASMRKLIHTLTDRHDNTRPQLPLTAQPSRETSDTTTRDLTPLTRAAVSSSDCTGVQAASATRPAGDMTNLVYR